MPWKHPCVWPSSELVARRPLALPSLVFWQKRLRRTQMDAARYQCRANGGWLYSGLWTKDAQSTSGLLSILATSMTPHNCKQPTRGGRVSPPRRDRAGHTHQPKRENSHESYRWHASCSLCANCAPPGRLPCSLLCRSTGLTICTTYLVSMVCVWRM